MSLDTLDRAIKHYEALQFALLWRDAAERRLHGVGKGVVALGALRATLLAGYEDTAVAAIEAEARANLRALGFDA